MSHNFSEEQIKAEDLVLEDFPSILDALLDHLGIVLVRESTPDYTTYYFRKKPLP